ncbi:MAG: hypothetical protein GXN95_00120 [Methanococci archaeon]|nr:hypothetical protein [Methanococci archaeon]
MYKEIIPIFLIFGIMSTISGYMLSDPLIVANKSTSDYDMAKILMENFYSSREVIIERDNVSLIAKDIYYIPAANKLTLNDGDKDIIVEFSKSGNSVKYEDIECIEHLNLKKGEEIKLFNRSYVVDDISSDKIILKEKDGKEIITNESFTYDDYKVVVDLVSADLNMIVVDIYKDGRDIDRPKLKKGELYYTKDGDLGIQYVNCTREGKSYKFTFKVFSTLILKEGQPYPLDNRFIVKEIRDDEIKLEYRETSKIKREIDLFNYSIAPEKILDDYVLFKVIKRYSKTYKVENECYLGSGIYALKSGDKVEVYYKGRKLKNKEKIYLGSSGIVGSNVLKENKDIVLIGGPMVNKIVRELEKSGVLKINITDSYPGKRKGLILKLKNPYSNGNIYILAGSDRWGTMASVLAFLSKYNGENKLEVEWINGSVKTT